MNLPFTTDQFLAVFAAYNSVVWPIQILFVLLALGAVFFAVKKGPLSNLLITLVLSFFWVWIGIVYHVLFFSSINPAAYIFGAMNIIQAGILLYHGLVTKKLSFKYETNIYGVTGGVLIFYGLLIYPILSCFLGHVYPQSPTFGLPCPTTIYTFGLLLMTDAKVPLPVLVIPFLWSLIGFTAALNLGIAEDTGLLVAGIVGTGLLLFRYLGRASS